MKVTLRRKKLKNGNTSLYLDIYINGIRNYEFLKLHLINSQDTLIKQQNKETLSLAENIRAKRHLELQNQTYGFVSAFKKQTNFIEYFRQLVGQRKDSGINYETWYSTLKHLESYSNGFMSFDEVDDQWMENFKLYLLKNTSQNTAHTYFNKVKAALYQAVRDKIIVDNPAERVKSPKQIDTKREYLTLVELKCLAKEECRYSVLKNAFLFSALTGLRWSDIIKMTWREVRLNGTDNNTIEFRQQKTKGIEYLPIPQQALELVGPHGIDDDKVFNGLKYSAYMNTALLQWVMRAGITKHITFHCARHTYATLLLTQGADIFTVSKLLGHRDLKTTQIYAKLIDEKKREAVNKLPNIELS